MLSRTLAHTVLISILGSGHVLTIPLYRWRNWGSERLSYLLRLKQLIRGRTKIWTQASCLHRPCFSTARSCLQRKVTRKKRSTSLNKRPRKPAVRKMKSSFNNHKTLNTYRVSGSVSSEPRGSHGNIPQRDHPEQESPMGPPPFNPEVWLEWWQRQ